MNISAGLVEEYFLFQFLLIKSVVITFALIIPTHFDSVFNPQLHGFPSLRAVRLRTFRVETLDKGIVITLVAWKRLAVERHISMLQNLLERRYSQIFSLLSSVRLSHFDSLIRKKRANIWLTRILITLRYTYFVRGDARERTEGLLRSLHAATRSQGLSSSCPATHLLPRSLVLEFLPQQPFHG